MVATRIKRNCEFIYSQVTQNPKEENQQHSLHIQKTLGRSQRKHIQQRRLLRGGYLPRFTDIFVLDVF